jgi:hypothetical protein
MLDFDSELREVVRKSVGFMRSREMHKLRYLNLVRNAQIKVSKEEKDVTKKVKKCLFRVY